jgi:hypothetical protein
LVEQPDSNAATVSNSPRVDVESLGQHLEQSRFAVAVSANHTNSVTFVDANGDAAENLFSRESERDVFSAKQMSQVLFAL